MQPRMLYHAAKNSYHAAKNAISCGQECYIMRPAVLYHAAKNAAISCARLRMLYLSGSVSVRTYLELTVALVFSDSQKQAHMKSMNT